MNYLIHKADHEKHPWKAHGLLPDFEIEDVWRLPVELKPEHSLELLAEQFKNVMDVVSKKGIAGMLFRLRIFLGKVFGWDEKAPQELAPSGSLRERFARSEGLKPHQLPPPGNDDFIPVYLLTDESLSEIENATVHAGIHFGRVPWKEGLFTIQMTVYVKPKGLLGRVYMWVIKPFRLFIVYPVMMKAIKNHWEKFLGREDIKTE